jgi:hypothetical protein
MVGLTEMVGHCQRIVFRDRRSNACSVRSAIVVMIQVAS